MEHKFTVWFKFSILNLLIVAILGLLMRYKIGFEFPYFDQKFIQHAHSHFAFSGWIAHTIFSLMYFQINSLVSLAKMKKYNLVINLNLLFAYGMLISFAIQGYGLISIGFSTLAVLNTFVFTALIIPDFRLIKERQPFLLWFKFALLLNIISSAGTASLAYMMASGNIDQDFYLASVYYYLHFQYNGFFFFACMGLISITLQRTIPGWKENKKIFLLFAVASIPTYFLSTLWMDIPLIIYILTLLGAILQCWAAGLFLNQIYNSRKLIASAISKFNRYLFLFAIGAFVIKILLQLGSTIPALSELAFGFRPIVIAYLHLVLLAMISVFLINYLFSFGHCVMNTFSKIGLTILVFGIFLNEFVLMIQGITSLSYTIIPFVNQVLFAVASIICIGMGILIYSQMKSFQK